MMRRSWAVRWLIQGMGALLLTQAGTACGLTDNSSDGATDASGSGGQVNPPWGTGGWIVEGCGSPTYAMTAHCYADCPGYAAERARCDPLCTTYVPPDCPGAGSGGAASDAAVQVLEACRALEPDGPSMGGWGGEAAMCAPVCGACSHDGDCCVVAGTTVCLEGICVYR